MDACLHVSLNHQHSLSLTITKYFLCLDLNLNHHMNHFLQWSLEDRDLFNVNIFVFVVLVL